MKDLKYFQNIIKQKRKNTPFRDFLKEIASFMPIVLHKRYFWVSRYPDTNRRKNIMTPREFYSGQNSDYFLEYDFSKTFFENFKDLIENTPVLSRMVYEWLENCEYSESVTYSKNVYLSFIVINNCENILYTFYSQDNCKDVINWVMVWDNSEQIYFSAWIIKWHKIFYSKYIVNSNNIWFSTNLIWCSECILCDNLENKNYCIKNIEYSKEKYFEEKEKILKEKDKFFDYYKWLNKTAKNLASKNTRWSFCVESENIENGYFTYRLKNARNAMFVWHSEWRQNVYDTFWSDDPWTWEIYGSVNLWWTDNQYLCDWVVWSNLYYCFSCFNCSYCIWCNWIINKSYCILNKQYSKEDWETMATKIFEQMENDQILGKFFPWDLNPYYFNDTVAWLIWDFSKQEVEAEWYLWRDEKVKVDIKEWSEIIYTESSLLPPRLRGIEGELINKYQWYNSDWTWYINPEILNKVIKDEKWNYYKITKIEYDFLIKHGLPLPEIHWMDRMKLNFWI